MAFISESFFSVWLYYSREELCLSGVSTFSWNSTDVSLLREFHNMKKIEGAIMPLGHSLHPKEVCPRGLWRYNSFMNSWKYYFPLVVLQHGFILFWGDVYLWETVEESDPCLFCKYEYLWPLQRENAAFLSLTTHGNFQVLGELVLKEDSK